MRGQIEEILTLPGRDQAFSPDLGEVVRFSVNGMLMEFGKHDLPKFDEFDFNFDIDLSEMLDRMRDGSFLELRSRGKKPRPRRRRREL